MATRVASRRNPQQAPAPAAGAKRAGPHVAEIAEQDVKRVCAPDLHRPFTSIDDAVDRLLPFHILAAEDAGEADRREAEEAGAPLAASRWDTWRAFAARRASELERKRLDLVDRIAAAEAAALGNSETVLLALHTYAVAEAERDLEAERRRQAAAKVAAAEARARAVTEAAEARARAVQEAARAAEAQRAAAAAAMQQRAAEAELNRHAAAQAMAAEAALKQQQAGAPLAALAAPAAAPAAPAAAPAAPAVPAAPAAAPPPAPAPAAKKDDPKSNVAAMIGKFGKKKK